MVQMRTMEILVGAFMAAGFVALFFLAMQVSNLSTINEANGFRVVASDGGNARAGARSTPRCCR